MTAGLVNVENVAKQMYLDAGNKTPEMLLNIGDENDRLQRAVEEVQAKADEIIQQMQQEMQKVGRELVKSEQKQIALEQEMKLKSERALTTENALREEIRALKAQMQRSADFLQDLGEIKDEKQKLVMIQKEIDHAQDIAQEKDVSRETDKPATAESKSSPVVVNIEKNSGFKLTRDDNGDLTGIDPKDVQVNSEDAKPIEVTVEKSKGFKIVRDENGDMDEILPIESSDGG
jgi:hypothetical protein